MKFSLSVKFVVGCSLILLTSLAATFYLINARQERLILRQAENEARAIFQQIVIMRKWIADHGGVFIEKLPWAQPAPLLAEPEIMDKGGRLYVKRTPAMVTKELSRYANEEGLYWFHITSLQLTNPENAPDDFEREALVAFERREKSELISVHATDHKPYLRYISPLFVEEACLACHNDHGYAVGDVRGAISVTLPLSRIFAEAAANRRAMFASMLAVVALLSGAMILMMRHLVLTPMKKLSRAIRTFSEGRYEQGELLRTGDEFEALSIAFADMAGKLTDYHQGLQEKIRIATRDLEEANLRLLEANRLLSLSNERKSDFLARASHELRTPLTSIQGSMDYITARLSQPAPADGGRDGELLEFFGLIRKNTDRLIRMVNTMLEIERIEMGAESVLQLGPVDLAALISECVTGFAWNAARRQVRIVPDTPENLPLRGDEDRLRQVLTNLLSNALKFSPDGSAITVTAHVEDGFATVEVADQGPGIPEEAREKVFEKFYKAGGKEGSGLGLAICRSIVEAHGGRVGVKGTAGGGVCVWFSVPLTGPGESSDRAGKEAVR